MNWGVSGESRTTFTYSYLFPWIAVGVVVGEVTEFGGFAESNG
jgi:hypothetical protein